MGLRSSIGPWGYKASDIGQGQGVGRHCTAAVLNSYTMLFRFNASLLAVVAVLALSTPFVASAPTPCEAEAAAPVAGKFRP